MRTRGGDTRWSRRAEASQQMINVSTDSHAQTRSRL
jgi:hypothetical protein